MVFTAIDLFCGCGGMSRGLEEAGIKIVAAIDFNEAAVKTHKKNFPSTATLHKDLSKLTPQEASELLGGLKEVDIIAGGPPCQAFSLARRRADSNPKDPRNSMFRHYLEYVSFFKPKVFIFENVVGIRSLKVDGEGGTKIKAIDIILEEMAKIGYKTAMETLDASHYDVPQRRKRVIIIGTRCDIEGLEPSHPPPVSSDKPPPVSDVLKSRASIEKDAKLAKRLFLSERAIGGMKAKKEKAREAGKGFGFQVLDLAKPSYTIPARYYKDGYDALVSYSENEYRRLDVDELAAIQTFPPTFDFGCVSRKDAIMQIGNAVPCKLAYYIGMHVIKQLLSEFQHS
jgi:DNA (cytosine-5)-methyltransferase 1